MAQETKIMEIKGELHTILGVYELLDTQALRGIPLTLRDVGTVAFYVRDGYGYARTIYVKGDFIVIPAVKFTERPTTFFVEGDETPIPENLREDSLRESD